MDKKHFLAITAGLTLPILVAAAHAQSTSAVFSGPQNMDAGLQNGMNNLTGYVYFLPLDTKMLKTKDIRLSKGSEARWGPHSETKA